MPWLWGTSAPRRGEIPRMVVTLEVSSGLRVPKCPPGAPGGPLIVSAATKTVAWTGNHATCVAATWQMAGLFYSHVHGSLVAVSLSPDAASGSRFAQGGHPTLAGSKCLGKGKGKVLGRSPNSSVSVIPTCPKAQHATSYYTHQNSCNSATVNSRET